MGRIVIATPDLSDVATLTGLGTIAAALPITNLQAMQPGKVCRWTSLSTIAFRVDLGAAYAINLAALGPHNGTSAATLQVRAGASEAAADAGTGYDSGAVSAWTSAGRPSLGYDGDMLWSLRWLAASGGPGAQTFRYWRFDFVDAANPDGYFDLGRLVLDVAWQPTRNLRYGWGVGWDEPSDIVRSIGGQAWPIERARGRILEFTLGAMTESEMMANAYEIQRKRGKAKDILVIRNPDATTQLHRQMVHGLLADLPPLVNRTFNLYETGYRLAELVI